MTITGTRKEKKDVSMGFSLFVGWTSQDIGRIRQERKETWCSLYSAALYQDSTDRAYLHEA